MSFVEGCRGRKGGHAKVPNNLVGICTGNVKIYTGYYADFFQLSKVDQEKVLVECKRIGQTEKGRVKNSKNPTGMSVKAITVMKAKLKDQTVTISDKKAKFNIETDDPVTDDSGD